MELIFVHGRAQQGKDPKKLQADWEAAMVTAWSAAGLAKPDELKVRMPFYGDDLAEMVDALEAPLVAEVTTKGASMDSKEAAFRGELLSELARDAGITDEEILAHYEGRPTEKGPLNWEWVHAILQALDHTPIGARSVDLFTRDAYVYLTNATARKAVEKIVTDQIVGTDCVVVGHSLGSVVAYNVLRKLGRQAAARRYVTVGSPLGVKAIQRLIVPPGLAMPDGLPEWFNAYDTRDVVALRPLDAKTFPVKPPVRNRGEVKNGTKNRHGIIGYLGDTVVSKWIHEALTS